MQFFILVLLICLFVFLYCVYLLANEDFIFLRKDVTMERLFNIIFLGGLISLFVSRLFYGLFYAKNILLNPFAFLLFPYFPGLSLLGGVLGAGVTFLFLRARRKNPLPLGRMSDFFSIAFLITLPIGFLGYFMLSEDSFSVIRAGSLVITYLILFIIFLRFLLPNLLSGKLKEGTISLVFLVSFSLVNLISNAYPKLNIMDYFKNLENIILVVTLITSLAMLVKQENLIPKIRKLQWPLTKINR